MNTRNRQERNLIRFWAGVIKEGPNNCWLWIRAKDSCGYGVFYANGRNNQAHRYSMQLYLGRELVSDRQLNGELVLHTCDNPACVNPNHLFIGTQADNIRDRDNKDKQSKGEHRYNHKLNDNKVRKIHLLRSKGWTLKRLASRFHVDVSTICAVVKGKAWKHVT